MISTKNPKRLIVILGDHLDYQRFLPADFDPSDDLFWMAEASEESTHVKSNKHRIVCFLSSMRHFRDHLESLRLPLAYHQLNEGGSSSTLSDYLEADLRKWKPETVRMTKPGDFRVESALAEIISRQGVRLQMVEDEHFLCSSEEFIQHAQGRKSLRLEFFYREMRRKHQILMDGDKPLGGDWNYDKDNRESFGKQGPPPSPSDRGSPPDSTTLEVIALVDRLFPDHPGDLSSFRWPVTPEDADAELDRFISDALPLYGRFQDAMWTREPTLFHSLISAPLNLRLLDPRDAVRKVEDAHLAGHAPLSAAEGFVRQVIGWREYVRGIYNWKMPDYRSDNFLGADQSLPEFFWTGESDMACMRSCLTQVLETGYGHHIQRLMVIGLYSLLRGIHPHEINDWFLASYVDAVDWVTTPNVIGMSQFADGGLMASKPYCATGAYVDRMSNYCKGCRYNPKESTGPNACPLTTLYWSFLDRHRETLSSNRRMSMQLRNLGRLKEDKLAEIRKAADCHLHQS